MATAGLHSPRLSSVLEATLAGKDLYKHFEIVMQIAIDFERASLSMDALEEVNPHFKAWYKHTLTQWRLSKQKMRDKYGAEIAAKEARIAELQGSEPAAEVVALRESVRVLTGQREFYTKPLELIKIFQQPFLRVFRVAGPLCSALIKAMKKADPSCPEAGRLEQTALALQGLAAKLNQAMTVEKAGLQRVRDLLGCIWVSHHGLQLQLSLRGVPPAAVG